MRLCEGCTVLDDPQISALGFYLCNDPRVRLGTLGACREQWGVCAMYAGNHWNALFLNLLHIMRSLGRSFQSSSSYISYSTYTQSYTFTHSQTTHPRNTLTSTHYQHEDYLFRYSGRASVHILRRNRHTRNYQMSRHQHSPPAVGNRDESLRTRR
jgi:hypothetical protein